MKVIVYLADGSVEATARADEFVARGIARYATPAEVASYESVFARDDARIVGLDAAGEAEGVPSLETRISTCASILPEWEFISTGGGCTALTLKVGPSHYLMMTEDAQAPETLDAPCTVGLYHREHTEELMLEYGYDWGRIIELKLSGAVK